MKENKNTTHNVNQEKEKLSELSKRFLKSIDILGITAYQLSKNENVSISSSGITNIKSGRNEPSKKVLDTFLKEYPNINKVWLLTGEGEMLNNKELSKEDCHHKEDINYNVYEEKYKIIENPEDIPEPFKRWVKPFYPDMRVGAGMMNGIFPIATKYFILVPFSENVEFWLPVEGKSMIPRYNHNDLVGISEIHFDGVFSKENYVVLLKSNSWHLKQVELIDDEFVWLNSYNPDFPPKKMSLDKIAKFFKVKMFIGNE